MAANFTESSGVLANIDEARRLSDDNQSVKVVAVVSGSEADKKMWQKKLEEASTCLFNKDKSSLVLSLQEKTGHKTAEGNFLGTLLAYRYIKKEARKAGVNYRDFVAMIGMIFGRGERISPITQAKACRKPAIEVTPQRIEIDGRRAFTAIEEALLYFVPVAKYLEKGGFRGILNKWGDETQIASVDLTVNPGDKKFFEEYDLIKFISVVEITDELSRQKEWVVSNETGDMVAQLSRNKKAVLIEELKRLGIKPDRDGKYYAGISLGPAAVSYGVLDIASEIFAKEIEDEEVHFDFDPYFFMALAMDETDSGKWQAEVKKDRALQNLISMIPDFFEKVQAVKKRFKKIYGRNLNIKIFDLGRDTYWVDIGQHSAMREKFLYLKSRSTKGVIARKIAGIPEERDEKGNIIINSEISSETSVAGSTIVNTKITGSGNITNSVIIDSELNQVDIKEAFVIRSIRLGKTVLKEKSGLYESLGAGELILEKGMRHVSVLTDKGKVDMTVSEETDLRDKENTYNVPVFNNDISFEDAYNKMFGTTGGEIEKRRMEAVKGLRRIKEKSERFKPLRFGTSGLRAEVRFMTDMECYINILGFIAFLMEKGEIGKRDKIAIGGDYRRSTPRIMGTAVRAIKDSGCKAVLCGHVPAPALANYAIEKRMPGIMVTGSHIPEDRNGIKFTKKSGEVLKTDEKDILRNVASVRDAEYAKSKEESLFNEDGMFKKKPLLPGAEFEREAIERYLKRYLRVFPKTAFKGKRIVLYQHSAVGRDIIKKIFGALGAEVIPVARSEKFVSVDTEKVSSETRMLLKESAEKYKPFAVISTDGDSDRPLLSDEKGNFLTGDKLGALVSLLLKPDFAAVPISANDAVYRVLKENAVKVVNTKIGSPYVIKAMIDELAGNPGAKVVSWESNGGFLLGSDWPINGKILKALPTRDAVLPLISVLLLARQEGKSVSELIASALPPRYTHANIIDNNTEGCEYYTAEMGRAIVKMFSPEDENIKQADFREKDIKLYYQNGKTETADLNSAGKIIAVRNHLAEYFTEKRGFGKIVSINWIDGIRIVFDNGDVSHIRPSGNAPEFRNYATADTEKRAEEIVAKRFEIVPEMLKDLLKTSKPKSLGAKAAGKRYDDNSSHEKIVKAVTAGSPVYVRPYREPKVWGVNGIGEYWYGAGGGDKNSQVLIDKELTTIDKIISCVPEEFFGKKVIEKFGCALPLVKILTPKARLSVQFHDTKNELWIITGINKSLAGGEPGIILGFSREAVEKYGEKVKERYKEVLEKYGAALNDLIGVMEDKGHKALLEKMKNVLEAAEHIDGKDSDVERKLAGLVFAEKDLKKFYNYQTVSAGDVIPIPAGTLHALGAGVEVVEPQIAGPTQALEDGPTYPVRYYFPGYKRPGAQKKLDLDRVNEVNAGITGEAVPELIHDSKGCTIERLPGKFEDKGLEVQRITLGKKSHREFNNITSFHNLVVIKGEAKAVIAGKAYAIPNAAPGGEMLIIPAAAGKYKIESGKGACIIDTFTPV